MADLANASTRRIKSREETDMQRPSRLISIFSFLLLATIVFGASGLPTHSLAQETATSASPPADQEMQIDFLGMVEVSGDMVPPDDPSTMLFLFLNRVTLAPGGSTPAGGHTHPGTAILTVVEGGICYQVMNNAFGTVEQATVSSPVDATTTCGDGIACDSTCTVGMGQSIFLPQGSTISQGMTSRHWYGNASETEPAVVYLSVLVYESPGAGCDGGCY